MDKKINFIIPYFGTFPNYMQLYLNCCGTNPEFNWTIITDNFRNYDFPENVRVIHTTFDEIRREIQSKFDFPVSLDSPYKLCDCRPMYGYLFSQLNDGYDFWGYCDLDVILGDLSRFITDEMLEFDKIFTLGHMTIMRNTDKINRMFMKPVDGVEYYKKVLGSPGSFNFDEEFKERLNINTIFQKEGIKIWKNSVIADIYSKSSDFRRDTENGIEKRSSSYFVWNNGRLIRRIKRNGQYVSEEYMYLHLQKRRMKIHLTDNKKRVYKIIPNEFANLEIALSDFGKKDWKVKKKCRNLQYFRVRYKNLQTKIKWALEK